MKLRKIFLYDLLTGLLCADFANLFVQCFHDTLSEKPLTLLAILVSGGITVTACLTVNRFIFLGESIKEFDERFRQSGASADALEERLSEAEEKLAELSRRSKDDSDFCKRTLENVNENLRMLEKIMYLRPVNLYHPLEKDDGLLKENYTGSSAEPGTRTDESGAVIS